MRIEKTLNKLDGVSATVNYATEKARISTSPGIDAAALIAEVEKTGYGAALPAAKESAPNADERQADPELTSLRHRLIGSIALSVPVIVLAMAPALQFTYWQWASLVLAAPVIVWGAWPFHRAAFANLRHGAATMDTLISVGTSAAFLWSLYALFLGTAGVPGMTHAFEFTIAPTDGAANIYWRSPQASPRSFWPDAISRSDPSARPALPCEHFSRWVRKTLRYCATGSRPASRPRTWQSMTSSSCGRARRSPPTASSSTAPRRSTRPC